LFDSNLKLVTIISLLLTDLIYSFVKLTTLNAIFIVFDCLWLLQIYLELMADWVSSYF
jgi:hypothetical protein